MMLDQVRSVTAEQPSGRWVREQVYASHYLIARQTLVNWRYKDRQAGRTTARAGYPIYRYFGKAVRYWLPADVS